MWFRVETLVDVPQSLFSKPIFRAHHIVAYFVSDPCRVLLTLRAVSEHLGLSETVEVNYLNKKTTREEQKNKKNDNQNKSALMIRIPIPI